MSIRRLVPLATALAAFFLASVGSASAQAVQLSFSYHAAQGYEVTVFAHQSTVILDVSGSEPKLHRGAQSSYVVRGATRPGRLAARFGDLGRVAMRFRPAGGWQPLAGLHGCIGGRRVERRHGLFIGSLRFRGEGGYLTTSVRRTAGDETSFPACGRSATSSSAGPTTPPIPQTVPPFQPGGGPATRLLAYYRSGPVGRSFEVKKEAGRPPVFVAEEEDVVDRLGTIRIAYARVPRSAFRTDSRLSSASLSGVGPFSGSARLSRSPNGARSWTGTLAVSFLGDPDVALTGPLFRTLLSRGF